MAYTIGSDTHKVGDTGEIADENNNEDVLGLLAAVLARLGTGTVVADPAGNAANIATIQAIKAGGNLAIKSADLPAASTSLQGAVVLESNAGNIQPTGTATAAGNSGLASAANHIHSQNWGGFFGDGSDGAVVFDGAATVLGLAPSSQVYTLTRDIFCTNVTINNGVTIQTGSCRIFCRGTLLNNGTIDCSGKNAVSSAAPGGTTGGNGSLRSGQNGGAGATTVGNAGSAANTSYGVGNAGAGGTGSAGAGGAAGTTNSQSSSTWMLRTTPGQLALSNKNGGTTPLSGASGGGGGGGDNTNSGGGGGGGGGFIILTCWAVINNGQINAHGGNGFTPATGNCGGGGAGAGGVILIYSLTAPTGSGSTNVAQGTPGNGVGSGTAGGTATAGTYMSVLLT